MNLVDNIWLSSILSQSQFNKQNNAVHMSIDYSGKSTGWILVWQAPINNCLVGPFLNLTYCCCFFNKRKWIKLGMLLQKENHTIVQSYQQHPLTVLGSSLSVCQNPLAFLAMLCVKIPNEVWFKGSSLGTFPNLNHYCHLSLWVSS